ncbi:hypothetical protein HY523_00335 [Candidatus Berkelbacteria bacterium]|nr:hypothetical protein [Candidatus Berkelbacteria bacterium]
MHEDVHHEHLPPAHTSDRYMPAAAIPAQSLERLTQAIEKLNQRYSFWYALLHGMSIGIGSTIGVALVLWIIFKVLSYLDFIPGIDGLQQGIENLIENR